MAVRDAEADELVCECGALCRTIRYYARKKRRSVHPCPRCDLTAVWPRFTKAK